MLDNKQEINIAAVQIPEKSKSTPRDKYETLKRTPLYDRERDQWNYEMDEKGNIAPDRGANNHLLSVLIDFQLCGKQFAGQKLERLKQIGFYDAGNDSWMGSVNEKQELQDFDYYCVDQLLYVFVEAQFDKEKAKQKLADLKNTPLYNQDNDSWNREWDVSTKTVPLKEDLGDQLLYVLVLAEFNKIEARKKYKELKSVPQWPEYRDQDKYSFDKLLVILVDHIFEELETVSLPLLPQQRIY